MNKKALVLLGALCLGATVGCDKDNSSSVNTNSTPAEQKLNYSIGLGYTTSFTATQAEVNVAVAAFDNAGKILNARIDVVQIPLTVTEGKAGIDTSKNPNQLSKLELGTDYNMLSASPIGKEVYLQIEAYTDWTVGKTVAEVKAGNTSGGVYKAPVNEELKNSVTIKVGSFEEALQDAYDNKAAATEGTVANAGVGIYVGMYGENELTTYVAGAITDKDNKVEAMLIDNVVFPLAVSEGETPEVTLAAGKYVGENNTIISKKKLGENYMMDDYMTPETCTGGDWYKQAAAYETAVVGKTATEIKALAKNSITGCTIIIEDINKSAAEAAEYASKEVITAKPQA